MGSLGVAQGVPGAVQEQPKGGPGVALERPMDCVGEA
jgi:hypothetical protein